MPLVQRDRSWSQVRALSDPPLGVVRDRHVGTVRIDPLASHHLCLDQGKASLCVALAGERLRDSSPYPVRSVVADLVAAGLSPPHAAETSTSCHHATLRMPRHTSEAVMGSTRPDSTCATRSHTLIRTLRPTLWNAMRRSA